MKVLRNTLDRFEIAAFPGEEVGKGEYLMVEDAAENRGLIAQVIAIEYANVPGVMEDILREVLVEEGLDREDYDPLNINSQINLLKDIRVLVCKVRASIRDGRISKDLGWLPSRTSSRISKLNIEPFLVKGRGRLAEIGETMDSAPLKLDLRKFDGRLNIIMGRKGVGKSHLSKLLVLNLVRNKAPCLVLDINGEYVNLSKTKEGEERLDGQVVVVTPGENFRLTLPDIGLTSFRNMLSYALDLPQASARAFGLIWNKLAREGRLTMGSLGSAIRAWEGNESVREALEARFKVLMESGLFSDDLEGALGFDYVMNLFGTGGAVVFNLKNLPAPSRRVAVELVISRLTEALSHSKLRAVFLFAEEAHLYLRETYWDDIVTRMRHLGIFTTFITNQPDSIDPTIYRQADNIFLFNFTNENDLEAISRTAKADIETIRSLVKTLPERRCLILGEMVEDFPIIAHVRSLDVQTMGETRYFFRD